MNRRGFLSTIVGAITGALVAPKVLKALEVEAPPLFPLNPAPSYATSGYVQSVDPSAWGGTAYYPDNVKVTTTGLNPWAPGATLTYHVSSTAWATNENMQGAFTLTNVSPKP